ncbi:ABC transporter permease subunit [Actinoallomurus acaciae]|uniref:ABC transporter permease subunit n=1 Tax=Actinoallomurus acaciae TaxID=502577 RepID=A0ABV5Y8W9_9ACTN
MTSGTATPDRPGVRAGRDGFVRLLHAEWTKFRTVRGWVIALVAAALVTALLGLFSAQGSHSSCSNGPDEIACPAVPVGPGGEAVDDRFSFVHRSLTGDGSITVRLTSLTGIITYPPPDHDEIVPGVVPWAKAGVIVKDGTRPGSAYAALVLTGEHGVRMQHDFTEDTAGRPGGASTASPRWLRLTRSGDTLTGDESSDGTHWTRVGTARLAGLRSTVQVGLLVTSPGDLTVKQGTLGGSVEQVRFTQATGVFDHVRVQGDTPGGAWSHGEVGATDMKTDWERYHRPAGVDESGGTFTVTGSGDIAPRGPGEGLRIENTLTGTFAGMIVLVIVAVLFITAEYRRGLIRTTLLAVPRRGRVLGAKAVVIGLVTFVAGLTAAVVAVPACTHILRANGNYILPVTRLTELRVMAGTAALLAVAAVFALALGALFRRSVAAVTAAVVALVLPHVLATASVLPEGAAQWLLRLTPAAAFAIQQSIPEYPQVAGHYVPQDGYYPLAPWAGLAVFCGYAALALGLAVFRLRRRDA